MRNEILFISLMMPGASVKVTRDTIEVAENVW